MFPSASLLLLLLLGLSQALPLHEEGDKDGDREHKGDLDDDKDGDREHKGDLGDDKDGHREHKGDLGDDKDGHREHKGDLDDDKDGDREHKGDLGDDKDGHREHKWEKKHDKNHDGHKEGEVEIVDITTNILTTNNGSIEILMEGDLVVPKHRNAIKCYYAQCLWSKGSDGLVRVPYVISSEYNDYERQVIEGAANAFSGSTCIRYTPRTNEYDYVSIVNKDGCYSSLGKVGGMQELSLNSAGCIYSGIAQHEMNHALGFQHEQVRSDRDDYVTINWQNIMQGDAYNFYKADTNNLNTPYDYGSIMEYGRDAFSIGPGLDTITPIPDPNVAIGQRNGLSYWDIRRINLLYQC